MEDMRGNLPHNGFSSKRKIALFETGLQPKMRWVERRLYFGRQ
jgi:hypothetical protein